MERIGRGRSRRCGFGLFRWAVGGNAGGLVWRLRSWLAPTAPGGLGLTVRPYYEGLPIDRLDEGRMNGGESCRDQGKRKASPSGHGRTVPRPKIATGGAPRGAPAGVIGR